MQQIITLPTGVAEQIRAQRQRELDKEKAIATDQFNGIVRKEMRNAAKRVVNDLEEMATSATSKVKEHINSPIPEISLKASIFAIDHVIGKATQKSFSRVERVNIDVVAD